MRVAVVAGMGYGGFLWAFCCLGTSEQWLTVVIFLQIRCFACTFLPNYVANLQTLKGTSCSSLLLELELAKKVYGPVGCGPRAMRGHGRGLPGACEAVQGRGVLLPRLHREGARGLEEGAMRPAGLG